MTDILKIIFKNLYINLSIALITIAIFTFVAIKTPNVYRTEAQIVSEDNVTNNASGILPSFAPLNIFNSGQGSKAILIMKISKSKDFFNFFYNDDQYLKNHYAFAKYDSISGENVFSKDNYNYEKNEWIKLKPNFNKAYVEFHQYFEINQDQSFNDFITLSYDHPSPEISFNMLVLILERIDFLIRDSDKTSSELLIEELSKKYYSTDLSSLKIAVNESIKSELLSLSAIQTDPEYVYKIIDSPIVPDYKHRPSRLLFIVAGALISIFIIMFIAFLKIRFPEKIKFIK